MSKYIHTTANKSAHPHRLEEGYLIACRLNDPYKYRFSNLYCIITITGGDPPLEYNLAFIERHIPVNKSTANTSTHHGQRQLIAWNHCCLGGSFWGNASKAFAGRPLATSMGFKRICIIRMAVYLVVGSHRSAIFEDFYGDRNLWACKPQWTE